MITITTATTVAATATTATTAATTATTAATTATTAATTAATMAVLNALSYGLITVFVLIALYSFREILIDDERFKAFASTSTIAIIPLAIVFGMIFLFNVLTLI